jgi:tetratricopeptide (TPR) repeat protein
MDNKARYHGRRKTVISIIAAVAERQPVLLIFEDLHWADPPTLSDIAAMAVAIRSVPAILLLTSRIDGDPLDAAWRAGIAGTPLATIDLGPLQEAEATALATSFIDATQRMVVSCVKRAEGNPLFLEQLLRNVEEGVDEQQVPGSIQSLVLARLDRLTVPDRRAAQVASVIGQQFDLAALRDLLGDGQYDCARLIDHGVIRPDAGGYLFVHALIHQGVYSSLLHAHRRSLHQRAAQIFAATDPVLRAQHLDRAEDAGAAAAYATAALAMSDAYRFDQALVMIERGLEIARVSGHDLHALTYLKGEVQRDLGDIPAAVAAYRQALEIAPDDIARCNDWIGLALVLRVSEDLSEALDLLDKAEAVATAQDLVPQLARLHHLRGNIYFPMGWIEGCRQEHEAGLLYAQRSQSIEAEARSLGGLGDAAYAQGRMRAARDYFTRSVDLSHQHGFGRTEVANRSMIGFSRLYLLEITEALADGVDAIETAGRVGHLRAELLCETICVMAALELGELDPASRHLTRAEELAARLGAHRFEAQNIELAGRILYARGQREAAAVKLREAVAMCRQVGLQFCGPKVLSILAVATADAAERSTLLEEGLALLELGAVGHNHLWFYRDAMEAMILSRDWRGALRHADALAGYTSAEPLPWADLFIKRAMAIAALGNASLDNAGGQGGDADAARAVLTELRAGFLAVGMKPYAAAIERDLVGA